MTVPLQRLAAVSLILLPTVAALFVGLRAYFQLRRHCGAPQSGA